MFTRRPHPDPRSDAFASLQGRVGAFRLRKIGVSKYDFRDPYYVLVTLPWALFLGLVIVLVLGLNLVFAALYVSQPGAIQNLRPNDFPLAFFFSVETMSTVGYGEMSPASLYGHIIATIEIIVGIGFTASLTGIMFVRLSKPRARILFAEQALVTEEGGQTVLSIRVANGRQMLLTNATAVLATLMSSKDEAGNPIWQIHRLALKQEQLSLFPLTWTVHHPLTTESPLAGFGAAEYEANEVRLYLMIMAHDPAINAEVQEIREYSADTLAFGRHYAEAISRDASGRVLADLSRVGELV